MFSCYIIYLYLIFFVCSLHGAFVPLVAYATSGQHGYAARVQQEPVNATVLELTNLDPFEDMVSYQPPFQRPCARQLVLGRLWSDFFLPTEQALLLYRHR